MCGCGVAGGAPWISGLLVAAVAAGVSLLSACATSHEDSIGQGLENNAKETTESTTTGPEPDFVTNPFPEPPDAGPGPGDGGPPVVTNPFPEPPDAGPGPGDAGPPIVTNPFPMVEDADGDGWDFTVDCNDQDPGVNPGAVEAEACCDGVDTDCDGHDDPAGWVCNCGWVVEEDQDGDGFSVDVDCNDEDPNIFPGATDYANGIDDDCDGEIDEDDIWIGNGMREVDDTGTRKA